MFAKVVENACQPALKCSPKGGEKVFPAYGYQGNQEVRLMLRTVSFDKSVGELVKLHNIRVEYCQYLLKIRIILENSAKSVKTRKRRCDLRVSLNYFLESTQMV